MSPTQASRGGVLDDTQSQSDRNRQTPLFTPTRKSARQEERRAAKALHARNGEGSDEETQELGARLKAQGAKKTKRVDGRNSSGLLDSESQTDNEDHINPATSNQDKPPARTEDSTPPVDPASEGGEDNDHQAGGRKTHAQPQDTSFRPSASQ
jgi:phage-related minor tail protein